MSIFDRPGGFEDFMPQIPLKPVAGYHRFSVIDSADIQQIMSVYDLDNT